MKKTLFVSTVLLASLALAGCSSSSSSTAAVASPSSTAAACTPTTLKTLTTGKLTIGTDDPAYGPWFDANTPSNGKGFESAVAYALATKLGYTKDQVTWVKAPFNTVIQPGVKPFDLDINQVSITAERKNAVDFSSGYYDVAQAIITIKGSKIAKATSIADLKNAKLGAQLGTTSYTTITDVIKPKNKPAVFDSNDIAKQALGNGQIDGLVVDLPTAFYITSVDLKNGLIIGQFAPGAGGEQFGMVLTKGSPITTCVSTAVDALRADNTLAGIASTWLATTAGAPVLK
jgi:polar amino acid transport system substrate-binding protein